MGQRFIAVAVVVASACTALHYSVTSQSSVVVSNNPHMFGSAGMMLFVISAAGSGDDDILQSITLDNCNSQWTLDTSIDPQQPVLGAQVCGGTTTSSAAAVADSNAVCPRSYTFAVSFAGTQAGTTSCNVVIETMQNFGSAFETETLVLSGIGSGSSGISVSHATIDFKDVQINTASSVTKVAVKNNGSAFESVTTSLTGAAFQVSPDPGTTSVGIGPGSSAYFDVTCNPSSLGPHAGSLSFTGNVNSVSTDLRCNGIDSTVTIQPTQVTFDDTLVGRSPGKQTITITGDPSAAIEMVVLDSAATVAGVTIDANPEGTPVGSGQDVVLGYAAAAMHAAGPLGTLSVKVSTDEVPRSIGISGQALLGGLGTNPASVELGAICANDTATKDIEVFASEAGDVVLQTLAEPAAPFAAMAVERLPVTLAGNHSGPSATVRVSLSPTAAGDFTDAIALTSNVPNMGTTEVQLHGIVLAGGIAATPNVVHFGTTPMGTTTSIEEIQLTNCGTGDLSFERAQIAGMHASEFTLIGANPARTLAPTESEIFMVVMQPTSPGFKVAQLVLEHSAGTTTADLDGTGDGEIETKERETYYACSTGHGTGAWPIALALIALRRRKRAAR